MSRGRLAKAAPAYVAKSDMKPKPDAGDGEEHLPDDPMAEIEALAAQHRKTSASAGMTKEQAVAHILQNAARPHIVPTAQGQPICARQKRFTLESRW